MKAPLVALLFAIFALPALAERIDCTVNGIVDGNSFSCLTARHRQIAVRLAYIDAPERAQPFGYDALLLLADLIFRKHVSLEPIATNDYGQLVAQVTLDGADIGQEMVSYGGAWVYHDYNRDPKLPALERQARKAKRGLWRQRKDRIVPPWEWREPGTGKLME